MKIALVDDEPLALSRLERMLCALGYSDISSFLYNPHTLQQLIQKSFDVIFLDINMPQSGVEIAKMIRKQNQQTALIFQTAYKEFAFDAFELNATDYLLKPFTVEQLQRSLEKIPLKNSEGVHFLCKNKTDYVMIKAEEIIYIKANLNEVMLRTKEDLYYYPQKISTLETTLLEYGFFKIHRSLLINTNTIHSIETKDQSTLHFYFNDIADTLRSSKEGAKNFRQKYEVTK